MIDKQNSPDFCQSIANRVLSTFIDAVADDSELAELAPRLKAALLETESLKEDVLRKALFGEGDT